jgi:hypothetical protein
VVAVVAVLGDTAGNSLSCPRRPARSSPRTPRTTYVLCGGSYSGNIDARDGAAAGLVHALASDYAPPALLAAAIRLAADCVLPLTAAVGLVTSGPARTAGVLDRGTIASGQRGDLVLHRKMARGVARADVQLTPSEGVSPHFGTSRRLTGGPAAANG